MPYPRAVINYQKCRPDKCGNGVCAAAAVCSQKVLKQEASYELPLARPSKFCKGCAKCNQACPAKAVSIV